ncbi:MAG: GNAT family N-acetyltransferase [Actinomycetales bacterium]|nr:GNAT family N-acetyltransferase [Actinomycetales bacterium]
MTWPVTLVEHDPSGLVIGLRPIRLRDGAAWREVRAHNQEWLGPWDASLPPTGSAAAEVPPSFSSMVRRLHREAKAGRMLPWAITVNDHFAGQVTVGGIAYGSLRSAYIGYWIDRFYAGRGVVPTAVAMALDYCFEALRLHRVEINIRPENEASLRVVAKLGIRQEGSRTSYLHIDGAWRDHLVFAVFEGEFPHGVLAHWREQRANATARGPRHADH